MIRYLFPLLLLATPVYGQDSPPCAIGGERLHWIADFCMSRLSTDDEITAMECINEELGRPFQDDCAAKTYYKKALCELALARQTVAGTLESCLADPDFMGATVRDQGIGAPAEASPGVPAAAPVVEIEPESPTEVVALEKTGYRGFFRQIRKGFSLYRENYLLPLTWSNRATEAADSELKFQFSFKQQLWRGLHVGYTQKSFWRVLDQEDSRPFRETNYNPALFYRWHFLTSRGIGWGADLGIEHESNGSREPDSRSWNRVYVAPFFDYRRLHAELKLWDRLSEKAKESPEDPTGDENPDITDFYGYSELRLAYTTPREHRASVMTRWNFATEKGGVQLDYSLPTGTRNLYIYAQFWSGYGESLIDYNRSVTRYGIGIRIM